MKFKLRKFSKLILSLGAVISIKQVILRWESHYKVKWSISPRLPLCIRLQQTFLLPTQLMYDSSKWGTVLIYIFVAFKL